MNVALGIDIGGTNTVFGLMNKDGQCLYRGKIATSQFKTADQLIAALANDVTSMLDGNSKLTLIGIGIGAPNGNYHTGTIEYAPNLQWKGVINLVDLLKVHFNVPVFVTNDANAAAIGEATYGSATGMKEFLLITLGTGLGSGFVSNGQLIYGHDGFAGELGHIIIDRNGRLCGCGRKGCLETYASATGIVTTAHEFLRISNKPSVLRKITVAEITGHDITTAAKNNDELALEIFDYTAEKLGFGIANVIPVTSPKTIILFGGLAHAEEVLLVPLRKYVEKFLLKIYQNKIDIIISSLNNNDAAILGASALAWTETSKY